MSQQSSSSIRQVRNFVPDSDWPEPIREDAYHGPIGRFVKAMEGKTEADPIALLIGCLVAFGNLVGRDPSYRIGGAGGGVQHTNLNVLVIGGTASGRKGTAWAEVEALFRLVDPEWAHHSIRSGLSSGEGLIHAVRDKVVETRPANEDEYDRANGDGMIETVLDPGVKDKRLVVREAEFGRVLDVAKRSGNTLTGQVRELWDSGTNATMTRTNPVQTTDAHVSLIADVTPEELRDKLSAVDQVNGFLNRFVPVLVRRQGSLPYPDDIDPRLLDEIVLELKDAADTASTYGPMTDHPDTRPIWTDAHDRLSEDHAAPLGPIVARASVHVRRIAMIYALADGTNVIEPVHMLAALAVWDYAHASATHVFGGATGDPTAEAIRRKLRVAPDGLTRTEISESFNRNKSARELDRALDLLVQQEKITCEIEKPPDSRKPVTRYRSTETPVRSYELHEKDEVTQRSEVAA